MPADQYANIPTSELIAERNRRRASDASISSIPTSELLAERARRSGTRPLIGADVQGQPPTQNPLANKLVWRPGEDVLAGLSETGRGLVNAPHNIAVALSQHGLLPAAISRHIRPVLPQTGKVDYLRDVYGIKDPGIMDKLTESLAQYAPYGAAAGTAGIARQAAAGGAYGLTQSQSPFEGAALGAGIGAASEALPALGRALKPAIQKTLDRINPQKDAESLMDYFSDGKSLEQNSKSLAKDIVNAGKNQQSISKSLFEPIEKAVGNNKIYQYYLNGSKDGEYLKAIEKDPVFMDRDLKTLHKDFVDNPTYKNAHGLQSEYGVQQRAILKQAQTTSLERSDAKNLGAARYAINSDINHYFNHSGNSYLQDLYSAAKDHHFKNVVPYKNKRIAGLAKQLIKNPRSIGTIFKNPESDVQKVVNDIGPTANRKILYSELGKDANKITAEKMLNRKNNLDQKGLESYLTPAMENQFKSLENRVSARSAANILGGALAGGIYGARHGVVPAIGGALAGATAGKVLLPSLERGGIAKGLLDKILKIPKGAAAVAASKRGRQLTRGVLTPAIAGRG